MKRVGTWLASVYLRELPRIVKQQRWTLLVALAALLAGVGLGFRAGREADVDDALQFFEEFTVAPQSLGAAVASTAYGSAEPDRACYYLGRNLGVCLRAFVAGAISLGLAALGALFATGQSTGFALGAVCEMWGVSAASAAGGILLPHSVLEFPALLLAGALGLRAGLAWVRPLPGLGRWVSVKRIWRDFAFSLLVIVPFLLVAAVLEAYVEPICFERFLLFNKAYAPGMTGGRRAGPISNVEEFAWSPDGERLAVMNYGGRRGLWLRDIADPTSDLLLAEAGESAYRSPTWSPAGKSIAVIHCPHDFDDREHYALALVDASSGELEVIPGGPPGRYLRAAWAPDGEVIAAVIFELAPGSGESRGINLWVVDIESGEWRKVTAFAPGSGVAAGSGLSWSPDGRALAFVRYEAQEEQDHGGAHTPSKYELCVTARDGTHIERLTELKDSTRVAWSPDGDWIAYVWVARRAKVEDWDDFEEWGDIRLIRPDGTDETGVLARADQGSSLSWSPDGTQLAYQRIGTTVIGTLRPSALP